MLVLLDVGQARTIGFFKLLPSGTPAVTARPRARIIGRQPAALETPARTAR
ncbi:hypothetical protein AB0J71_38395 [Nonomuraea sp. NPDC049637]|uniref:hypothetical protein n=1 Tax=Nonomuraea sp. NPDC049637 TaxID=3154356 RepID=UPI0034230D58